MEYENHQENANTRFTYQRRTLIELLNYDWYNYMYNYLMPTIQSSYLSDI